MFTLLLLFALQVANSSEMACIGSIQEMQIPEDVYIAGLENEGTSTMAIQGHMLYLNGPGVSFLKTGSVQKVVRAEGKIKDPRTQRKLGIYYTDVGTVRIEAVDQESAVARVLSSCGEMRKGDMVVANTPRQSVEFNGTLSTHLTSVPRGLTSSILLGKNDVRQLSTGQFCFIQAGKRDGVKPGDRFTIFRPHPEFNPRDMGVAGSAANASYSSVGGGLFSNKMESLISDRVLPPKILGDLVIVDAGEKISTGKIINSFSEVSPGDLVVKR